MKDKAILISTGEELEIDKSWVTIDVKIPVDSEENVEFIREFLNRYKEEIKIGEDFNLPMQINNPLVRNTGKPNRTYYLLSNGMKVKDDEVIVGRENIRDYKINQINGI